MPTNYDYTDFRGEKPDFTRVLFLEIEGVLNSESYFSDHPEVVKRLRGVENPGEIDRPSILLDPEAVDVLNTVVRRIEPTVVLTSVWRKYYSLTEVESFLDERGYKGSLDAFIREGDQINPSKNELILWCEDETAPTQFLVLDTVDLRGIDNQILVDSATGLSEEDARRVLEHFDTS